MIAPMQYTLGILTSQGTSPNAVARIRITMPNGPVRMILNTIINAITERFSNLPSMPLNLHADRDNAIVITIRGTGGKNSDYGHFTHSRQRKFGKCNHHAVAHPRQRKQCSKSYESICCIRCVRRQNICPTVLIISDKRCEHAVCRCGGESRKPPDSNSCNGTKKRTFHNSPPFHSYPSEMLFR